MHSSANVNMIAPYLLGLLFNWFDDLHQAPHSHVLHGEAVQAWHRHGTHTIHRLGVHCFLRLSSAGLIVV